MESHCRMKDTERLSVNSVLKCNHGQILKTHLHLWGSLLISHAQPLPHPTNNDESGISRIFPEFQLCTGWGKGGLQDIFKKLACYLLLLLL